MPDEVCETWNSASARVATVQGWVEPMFTALKDSGQIVLLDGNGRESRTSWLRGGGKGPSGPEGHDSII